LNGVFRVYVSFSLVFKIALFFLAKIAKYAKLPSLGSREGGRGVSSTFAFSAIFARGFSYFE
jgi:hypothetical protein